MCMTAHFNSLADAVRADVLEGRIETAYRPGFYRNHGKRLLDVALVLLAAPIVLPLTLLLAIPMALEGGSPFYHQRRVGHGGRTFVMWKLRSMVVDADERLARYLRENPEAREEWARHQKLRNDPRITPYGRFLRKLSLDELPQLWNVLVGDMSLIGPRPMMPHQRALYSGLAYYALRPGVSGFWQVSDRNDSEFVSRVIFDDLYDREVSVKTDVALILQTLRAVVRGTGL
jgi:lipopolysaccharide/colanic/teichoic acid biosynthesis glycosyltransferase